MHSLLALALFFSLQEVNPDKDATKGLSAEDEAVVRYLFDGWKAERQKVLCGSFTLTSEFQEVSRDGSPTGKSLPPLDYATSLRIRFDRARRFEEQVRYKGDEVIGYHALTPESRTFAPDLKGFVVSMYPPEATPHVQLSRCVFDWCVAGCFDSDTIQFDGVTGDDFINRFRHFMHIVAVHPGVQPGLHTIEARGELKYADGKGGLVEKVTFDEAAGFSIISRTLHFCRIGDEETVTAEPPHLAVTCEWQQKGDVWVPLTLHFSERWAEKAGIVRLDWQTINDCSATQQTSLEKSVLPDALVVSDRRVSGGPPLTVGQLGELRAGAKRPTLPSLEPRIGRRGYIIWLINIGVLFAFAAWWAWRTFQARRHNR